jgi:hypothetical protein
VSDIVQRLRTGTWTQQEGDLYFDLPQNRQTNIGRHSKVTVNSSLPSEAADEIDRLRARVAELERTCAYVPCEQHKGLSFTMVATVGPPMMVRCPICEGLAAAPAQTKGGASE